MVTGWTAAFLIGTSIIGGLQYFGVLGPKTSNLKLPPVLTSSQGRQITARQAAAPRRVVYGACRAGGIETFMEARGGANDWMMRVVTLAGHELQEIGTMYFDGVAVPVDGNGDATDAPYVGLIHVEKAMGTDGQAAIAGLVADCPDKWTSNHRQRGCAHVYIRMKFDPKDGALNNWPNVTFDLKGAKLYDPRTATTIYSSNAALAISNYLCALRTRYGVGADYATEINEDSLIAAANICDEQVAVVGSPVAYENRYEINGIFDTSVLPGEMLRQMQAAMGGFIARSTAAGSFSQGPGALRP